MSTKTIKLTVKLASGNNATLYLGGGNFVVTNCLPICIDDGVHNNGGWKLANTETYEQVIERIDAQLREPQL